MTVLSAVSAGLVRRLLQLEVALVSAHFGTANALKLHKARHARTTVDLTKLESTHRLFKKYHTRNGNRHKAIKGALSTLRKRQARAKRQRLGLRKSLRASMKRQNSLERQIAKVQQVLESVLQVRTQLLCTCYMAPHCKFNVLLHSSLLQQQQVQ